MWCTSRCDHWLVRPRVCYVLRALSCCTGACVRFGVVKKKKKPFGGIKMLPIFFEWFVFPRKFKNLGLGLGIFQKKKKYGEE